MTLQNAKLQKSKYQKKPTPLTRCFWEFGIWSLAFCFFAVAPVCKATGSLKTDIEYGRVGEVHLLLDVYVPEGEGPFPVAILVHGGGWREGDKAGSEKLGSGNDITPWFAPLRAAHFTYFSINYRHAPTHRWPACFEDVQSAIRWVKRHASEYRGDPGRIVLFGHSAGGHLVCLAATEASDDTRVQAVVGFAPVTDFQADVANRGGLSQSLQNLFHLPKEPTPDSLAILRDNSPLTRVKPGLPPFLLVHGDADVTVPLAMSVAFQAKLRTAEVPCDLMIIRGAPHRLVGWEKYDRTYSDRVIAWLRKTLSAGAAPASSDRSSIRLDGSAEVGTTTRP